MSSDEKKIAQAPGWPGIPARWTSSAKSGVGKSIAGTSKVWFTLSHGILNEIYYPYVDTACTRDMGLIVTDGKDFFSEEKRDCLHESSYIADGVPGYILKNTCKRGRYRMEKEIIADPSHNVVLQQTKFVPLQGSCGDYHVYVLLAPHLLNRGSGQTARLGDYKGREMLFASREGIAVALACSRPWKGRTAAFAGKSDLWQDLRAHKKMTWFYDRAENGNVALGAEIDIGEKGEFLIAVGFGDSEMNAAYQAHSALVDGFDGAGNEYREKWGEWQKGIKAPEPVFEGENDLFRTSCAIMHVHEAKDSPGAIIASLSVPWGFSKGDDDLGGYHLVWPRDLVEIAGGLHAAGDTVIPRRVVKYLQHTQDPDGKWPQNMWINGSPYWSGVQMDETALPIIHIDHLRRAQVLNESEMAHFWPMVKKAAEYLVRNGPVTPEDRWEVDPGYSPFTLAAEIAALLCAADIAETQGQKGIAAFLRDTADIWNDNIERWTYIEGSDQAREAGVPGHYVRIGTMKTAGAPSPRGGFLSTKKQDINSGFIVGPDALALMRFGLRAADDPWMIDTVKVIDCFLKRETKCGPAWRRYPQDMYGEHRDGSPYDGSGVGRSWPLLTGERAHYELARGNREAAIALLRAIENFANEGGLIPEQVWDAADIPEKELFNGRPSGSAMPLVWAHAEYVKLRRSLKDNRIFDMPPQTVQRYQVEKRASPYSAWRFNNKKDQMHQGKILRLECQDPARVRWSMDGWKTISDTDTTDSGIGIHFADLPTDKQPSGTKVEFTFYWPAARKWEHTNFAITIKKAP